MTGPMVGSGFPGTSRFAVCAKSPLTGIWGESACGGTFGPELKKAGYDGIVITGRAEKPVSLFIVEGEAKLRDAADLWGRDTYETTDLLKKGDPGLKVLAIGPAGENLVRFAAIGNDKGHFVGRTGLGAVMGSKRLKAICVRGSGKLGKGRRYPLPGNPQGGPPRDQGVGPGRFAPCDGLRCEHGHRHDQRGCAGEELDRRRGFRPLRCAERSDSLRDLSHPRPRLRPLSGGLQAGRPGTGRPLSDGGRTGPRIRNLRHLRDDDHEPGSRGGHQGERIVQPLRDGHDQLRIGDRLGDGALWKRGADRKGHGRPRSDLGEHGCRP